MTAYQSPAAESVAPTNPLKPWRIWIPLLLLPGMIVCRFVPGLIENAWTNIWMVSAFGPALIGIGILLWFGAFSRAGWWERLLGLVGVIALLFVIGFASHPSILGPVFMVLTIPLTIGGFALGAILFGRTLNPQRVWYSLAIAVLLGSFSTLLKTDGAWGNFQFGLDWRWTETAEERFLAKRKQAAADKPPTESVPPRTETVDTAFVAFESPEWPGLRGPNFDSVQHGVQFSDDWKANPPKELWRIDVGPAWSSFAVAGEFLVTQEQRGESEFVVCYNANTGEEVWAHGEEGRFFDSLGGLGPRATPTLHGGYVYAHNADGKLLKLNAKDGSRVWKINLSELLKIKAPMWGFSSSPLVHQDKVIVHAANESDSAGYIYAFNAEDGNLAWKAPAGKLSYASVQTLKLFGETYLALLSEKGLHLYQPESGQVVSDHVFEHSGYRALQPQVVGGDKIIIPTGLGSGTRLVQVTRKDDKVEFEELWTSLEMKPDFNDLVVHQGYIYGFDNNIFSCISLEDGKRQWKGGRYEKGQAILLADSDLIIVVSERGDLVLLRASPDKLQELAKIPALKNKTWNHPVVVGNRLYIRNAEQAVCYELATK